MNRNEYIDKISELCKLVRVEVDLSQDKMAQILGISKKSLVETEKGRRKLSFSEAVALSCIFSHSAVLHNEFGGEMSDMIEALAFAQSKPSYPKTMGGKVWWKEVSAKEGYRIQQNLLSGHYRILNPEDERMMSSFDLKEVQAYFDKLNQEGKR